MDNKIYPFKFLDSYTAEDKEIFFGRDEEIKQLYEMIYQSDILLLYGASGTGKTSLIQCGLASQFQKHDWLEVFIRRHKNLNESLRKSLISVGGQGERLTEEAENLDWLNDLMGDGQSNVATKALSQTQVFLKNIYLKHFRPIYLIFDQFEELFILGNKKEQAQFIATVQEILKVEQPVKLIFSIREEYLGSLYEFEKVVPELLRKKLRIDPMNLEKVKAVVLGATRSKKSIVHIKEEEAEAISEQVFEKIRGKEKTLTIQLPYLQVFLDKFYRHISKDKAKIPITEATYTLKSLAEIGDIGNILRDFLDEQIVEIANEKVCERKTIWKILSPFVTIDGTKEPIGIDTLCQNFPEIPKELIEHVAIALMNNRILRYLEEEELYEIAHDSLALRIAEKRSDDEIALLEVRNLIKSQSLLKDEARELFSEKQLDFISPFLERLKLSAEEVLLIEESKDKVVQSQKEATRRKLILLFVSVSAFVVLLIAFLITQKANERNEKIVNAMDFYDEKFALAFKNGKYGFIDKDGKEVIGFDYDKGEPFDPETGFAEMEINIGEGIEMLRRMGGIMVDDNTVRRSERKMEMDIDRTIGKGKMMMMVRNFFGMKIEENIKYLIDTSRNKYQLINIYEALKGESNLKPILSQEEIEWLEKKLAKNKKQSTKEREIWNKLDKAKKSLKELKVATKNLIETLNLSKDELALDFSGMEKNKIINILQIILKKKHIKDKVVLLFLNNTDLDTLPDFILEFKNLKRLDISLTRIEELPSSFCSLENLVKLDFTFTPLRNLPDSIGFLTKLEYLNGIYLAGIEELPLSFYELENLKELDLSGIESTSKYLSKLKKLEHLTLSSSLDTLPSFISDLIQLQTLDLSNTSIKKIPESISSLKNLKKLYLPDSLEKLPNNIFDIETLETLYLAGIKLKTIPESISSLKNLKKLYLPDSLEKLPNSIFDIETLEMLDLAGIRLKTIPESIANLINLKKLHLPSSLEKLPGSIFDMQTLEVLDLRNTKLRTISKEIGNLINLKEFFLSGFLGKLPNNIIYLKNLEVLDISNNPNLKTLPDISNLKKLSWFSYTLYKNENYTINKAKLEALQRQLPNCYFDIKDENE